MTYRSPARSAALVLALAVTASPAFAGRVKTWHSHAPSDHEKAQLQHAVVTNEGALRLSHRLRPLVNLDVAHVWDVVEDGEGNLYAATGDEGKVVRIGPDGKAATLWSAEQVQVLCLAVAAQGVVYAGTGPDGKVVRIDGRGARVLTATGESYVWSLAIDAATGDVIAGTGPKGRVLRISPEGKVGTLYATRQDHVLCVAAGPEGAIYAGTDQAGLVLRIDARGKPFVLFQAPQPEVRRLVVTADAIYAATSAPNLRRRGGLAGGASRELTAATLETPSRQTVAVADKDEHKVSADKKSPLDEGKDFPRGHASAATPPPSGGENSVWRISHDGAQVREIFREKTLVLSVLRLGRRCLVGTGMEGRLFDVEEVSRERSEIARLDHGQVLGLWRRRGGDVVVAAGDPGRLYLLEESFAARGSITSEVHDAKLVSRWGALRFDADVPEKTAVGVAVRSGNVAEPDETWSDWSPEQSSPTGTISAPPARFLQYRVTLSTNTAAVTPSVRSVTIRYANANQAPEVLKVEAPDVNAVNLDNPRKLRVRWTAQDANEDDLTYSVWVRKEGWKNWVQLEDDLDKAELEWDTTTTPDGIYRIKVVASDHKDNREAEALTGQRISGPFVVCHTPPTVTLNITGVETGRAQVEATVSSPLVRLTTAAYAVDGKRWVNVFPTDGLFDARSETFAFPTATLRPGTHVLVLRVKDAAGNTGSADVVFDVPMPAAR